MKNVRIASPMFLDRPSEAVAVMRESKDLVIAAAPGPGEQIESVAPIHRELAETVTATVQAGDRPFAVLGDCCQVIAMMAGIERAGVKPALLWIDCHGDFNTWETTPSGFLGGMPLAMLTGRGDQRMMQAVALAPVADTRVVLSDGRDLDPGERELVEASGIKFIPDFRTLDAAALPDGPLYVHFDSDIIDATEAPAFLYPAKGGPTAEQTRAQLVKIMATGRVMAISTTVGWHVAKDGDGATQRAVRHAMTGLG
jgi:arginase